MPSPPGPDKKVDGCLTKLVIFAIVVAVILFIYAKGRESRTQDEEYQQDQSSLVSYLIDQNRAEHVSFSG